LIDGRFAVSCEDIRKIVHPVLRHRVMLSFEGHSDRITPDELIDSVIDSVAELSE